MIYPQKIDYLQRVIYLAKESRRQCFALKNHCQHMKDFLNAEIYDRKQSAFRETIERAERDIELLKRAN